MYAMQYDIPLPADYDMGIIRQRVADKGHFLDDFPGLGIKAYLIRERGVDGSPVNEYAPFYLWLKTEGMGRFLWGGGGFGAIVQSFGRPPVAHWTGVQFIAGPASGERPVSATRAILSSPPGEDPALFLKEAQERVEEEARSPDVMALVLAVDPRCWQILHFCLRAGPSPVTGTETRYQVLHLSRPGLPFHNR